MQLTLFLVVIAIFTHQGKRIIEIYEILSV